MDLTRADAYAVRLLEALGSKSIPLTALFPAGAGASRPLVLRDVYGVRALESALQRAFDGSCFFMVLRPMVFYGQADTNQCVPRGPAPRPARRSGTVVRGLAF